MLQALNCNLNLNKVRSTRSDLPCEAQEPPHVSRNLQLNTTASEMG